LLIAVAWLGDLSLLELTAVLSVCLLSPVAFGAAATVTNDGSAVAAGSAVLGTALLARRRGRSMAVTGLSIGLVVGLMKGLFVVAPFTLLAALVIADVSQRRKPTRSDFWTRYGCSLMMFIGAFVSYVGWLLIQNARATVPPSTILHALQSWSTSPYPRLPTFFAGVQNGLSGLMAYVPAPLYWLWNLSVYGSLAGVLILRGPVARPQLRAMASAIFVGIIVLAAAFPLLNFVEGHYDFSAPARYALPLLPIIAVTLVRALRTRGLFLVGLVLPAAAVIDQVATGKF
jgi:hypothetical protein